MNGVSAERIKNILLEQNESTIEILESEGKFYLRNKDWSNIEKVTILGVNHYLFIDFRILNPLRILRKKSSLLIIQMLIMDKCNRVC
jgi:hypothetical protein